MRLDIGSLSIEVVQGDITEAETEAIVNAANNHLWMGAGVAGAIKRRGGEVVEKDAVAKGPIPVGGAVESTAGKLPHRCVIHGAVMGTDLRTDAKLIAETTHSCLRLAEDLGLESLAFPAFGTGVGGFDVRDCAEVMAKVVSDFALEAASLKRVVFVLYGDDAYRAFHAGARVVLS